MDPLTRFPFSRRLIATDFPVATVFPAAAFSAVVFSVALLLSAISSVASATAPPALDVPSPEASGALDPNDRWAAGFAPTGCNGVVFALTSGGADELYVGGLFSDCGGVAVNNIARYEPSTGTFQALGSAGGNGVDGRVRALAWVDGELYAGGEFLNADLDATAPVAANRIARWDGAAWHALGSGAGNGVDNTVLVLAEVDGELYAGGNFTVANLGDPLTVNHLARWDGSSWFGIGADGGVGLSSNVFAIAEFAGDLIVGGTFQEANAGAPVDAKFLAAWDGTEWSAIGTGDGPVGVVSSLAVMAGDLFVGGSFVVLNQGGSFNLGNRLARWDGTAWSALGSGTGIGVDGSVIDLAEFDGDLYIAGSFTEANVGEGVTSTRIVRWDGSVFSPVGSGGGEGLDGAPNALAVAGDTLYVAGALNKGNLGGAEVTTRRLAAWDGTTWSPVAARGGVESLTTASISTRVLAMAIDGDLVYVGGFFSSVGGVPANNLAVYERSTGRWSAIGSGVGNGTDNVVRALLVDAGDLYVGGDFTAVNVDDTLSGGTAAHRIARWDGASLQPLGSGAGEGFNLTVLALASCGGGLYAGGGFNVANLGDDVAANRIARWDGSTWQPLVSGAGNGVSGPVLALACDGTDLYAGGNFVLANQGDPATVNRIARWDGSSWHPLGSDGGAGANSFVNALAVADGRLYAGGTFSQVNVGAAQAATGIAAWDGSQWSTVGGGVNGAVRALMVDREQLYVGGQFTQAGSVNASNLAHWTGSDWVPLAAGVDGAVGALAVPDPGLPGQNLLVAGGEFATAGAKLSSRIGFYETRGMLDISINGGLGSVTSMPAGLDCPGSCSADFPWDLPVTLTATPQPGYTFDGFTGACSGIEPCVAQLAADASVGASFSITQEADLSIAIEDAQDPVPAGVDVVYSVEVTNLAPLFDASGVTITASLPSGFSLLSTSGCQEDPLGLPTCTLGPLDAGAVATVTIEASVGPGTGELAAFEVCVAGADTDPQPANNCATETTALDLEPPTITSVAAGSGSASSQLGACSTVRTTVRNLQIAFSEPLLSGLGNGASVDEPGNYRLVSPAPGSDFGTVDCLSDPGTDTVIPISSVSWDAGTASATLEPSPAFAAHGLGNGLYRLLVCGSLEDLAGNPLDGGAGAGTDLALIFRIDEGNHLADGHFDRFDPACGLDAWISSDIGDVEIAEDDADDSPLSGSAGQASSAAFDLAQCVELQPLGLYELRAAARADNGTGDLTLFCEHYPQPACTGMALSLDELTFELTDTGTSFEALELELDIPAGTASSICGVTASTTGAGLLFADQLRLGEKPIFADGFESGDISDWSQVVP